MSILCIPNNCTNGCTTSADLAEDDGLTFFFSSTRYHRRGSFAIFRAIWLHQVKLCRGVVKCCALRNVKFRVSSMAVGTSRTDGVLIMPHARIVKKKSLLSHRQKALFLVETAGLEPVTSRV